MDSNQFDALTRALATGITRRRLLAAIGGIGATLLPTRFATRSASAAAGCAEVCDDSSICDARTGCGTCCSALCVNLLNDVFNCGDCGMQCAQGEGCFGGICKANCDTGLTRCGDACVDLASDPENCGQCQFVCAAGLKCAGGTCAGDCDPGELLCAGICVDIESDPANCGGCGAECPPGQLCRRGDCTSCSEGLTDCDGACVDLTADTSNCGVCGNACAATQVCNGGACASTCPSGQVVCAGLCTDLSTDPANCGGCGVQCSTDARCAGGGCIQSSACRDSETRCGDSCVDTTADPDNCGGCGITCDPDETCQAGLCTSESATTSPSGTNGSDETISGPVTPDPAECTVPPRTAASLVTACSAVSATATPVATFNWDEIAGGQAVAVDSASGSDLQRLQMILNELIACGNAGDLLRQTALMTDQFAGSILRTYGMCAEVPDIGAVVLPDRRWRSLYPIRQAFSAGDDRMVALVEIGDPGTHLDHVQLFTFVAVDDVWRIDRIDPIDPAPGRGSVTVRYFDCAGKPLRDAACQPGMVTHGLSLARVRETTELGLGGARITGLGEVRWSPLAAGAYALTVAAALSEPLAVDGAVPASDRSHRRFELSITESNPNAVVDLFVNGESAATLNIQGAGSACGATACPACHVCDEVTGSCVLVCVRGERCQPESNTCVCVDYAESHCLADRGLCLGDADQICASDEDCCDGRCLDGACACLAEGEFCETDQGCCPGFNCDYGTCSGCRKRSGDACEANQECCDSLCIDGVCQCCQICRTADGAYSSADYGLCCGMAAICYPDTDAGPGFARCCTPGIDCLGDPAGPPPVQGANAISRNTCFTDLD